MSRFEKIAGGWMDGWMDDFCVGRTSTIVLCTVRAIEKKVWGVRVFVHIRNARRDARVRCDVSTLSGIVVSEGRSGVERLPV